MTNRSDDARTAIAAPQRLGALRALDLLDTPAEEAFDRAVRLATRVLNTEVGLFSLVDADRQFFKAQTGLAAPYDTTRETPLSHSFCQHVVTSGRALVVRDAREDARLRNNAAIRDLNVIAYLGVPVRDGAGHVLGSFCAIQSEPRDWTDEDRALLEDIAAGVESEIALRSLAKTRSASAEAEAALRQRLVMALKSGAMGTYDLDLTTGIADWDPELYALWGLPETVENPFDEAISRLHPDDVARHEAAFAACLDPAGDGLYAQELRIHLPDGSVRWLASTGLVTFDGDTPRRMVGTVQDITKRKEAEEHAQLLAQELNHRVKNLFAITNGIIALTAREHDTPAEMATALRARIVSLSAAHDLVRPAITRDAHTATETDLKTLARTILAPHLRREDGVVLSGVAVPLSPKRASSLALVLHEMATNAGKYGALSVADGRLMLTWTLKNDTLRLIWQESGGPKVDAPSSEAGFGSTLIDMTVRRQMRGDYSLTWRPEGLTCAITLPWEQDA